MIFSVNCGSTGGSKTSPDIKRQTEVLRKELGRVSSGIQGPVATPGHSLPRHEFPFDSRGNYRVAWALEGERRIGSASTASSTVSDPDRSSTGSSTNATPRSRPAYSPPSYTPRPPVRRSDYRPSTSSSSTSSGSSSSRTYHRVSPGETLWSISRRHQVAVSSIKDLNGLSNNHIIIGQRLRVR